MRHIILILTLLISLGAKAQFYQFETTRPQQREQVKKRQKRQQRQTPPKYRGGKAGMEQFMMRNFINPTDRDAADGTVVVAVIVGTKGKVEQAEVVRGVSRTLNAEALRVARMMKFRPAKVGKKKVRSRFDISFPIRNGRLSFVPFRTIEV